MKKFILLILLCIVCPAVAQVGFINGRIDSLEFEITYVLNRVDIAQVNASDYWVVFWSDATADGRMGTFTCSSAGVLSNDMVDTWEFADANTVGTIDAVPVAGSDFILFTWGNDAASRAYISTISISSANGNITESLTTLNICNAALTDGKLLRLGETNNYVLSYQDDAHASDYGKIKTFSVNPSTGAIAILDSLEWFTFAAVSWDQDIIQVGSGSYYLTGSELAVIESTARTVLINAADGVIAATITDSLNLASRAGNLSLLQLGSTEYYISIGQHTVNTDIQIYTYTVNSTTGQISEVLDNWDSNIAGHVFKAFWLGEDKIFIWGGGYSAKTASISSVDGTITKSFAYNVTCNPTMTLNEVERVSITDSIYVFLNAGRFTADNDGWLYTASAKGVPESSGWSHKISGISTPAYVNGIESFTSINGIE